MKKNAVDGETRELDDLVSKMKDIALSDPEAYKFFSGRAEKAAVALANLKDTSGLGKDESDVLAELGSLRFDFENYLSTGSYEELKALGENNKTGIEKLKLYRVSVFADMAKLYGAFNDIDIENIKKLKAKWDKEKKKTSDTLTEEEMKRFERRHVIFSYSEAEINIVERALAELFINYQIKYAKEKGILPPQSLYSFTDKQHYVEMLKGKIVEKVYSMEKGSPERTSLEMAYLELKSEDLLTDKEVWNALVGKEVLFPEKMEEVEPVEEPIKAEPVEEKSLIDPSSIQKTGIYQVALVYNGPGGVTDVRKKVKTTDENGRMTFVGFSGNKDVRELYFLEGIESLRWTRNGNSSDNGFRYTDYQNLRSIYLPSSLKEIEQGFFLGFKNLKYIYLPKGMINSLDPKMLPEGVKVVEEPLRDENGRPSFTSEVKDMEEQAVILRRKIAEGEELPPIKRKLSKHNGLPEKLHLPCETSEITEMLLTNGIRKYDVYDTEYDGMDSFTYDSFRFSGFENLSKVVLPESLEYLDRDLFRNCKNLKTINIPKQITSISKGCFYGCESLQDIDLSHIVGIYDYAFFGCKGLKNLSFSNELGGIMSYAFSDCDGLTEVTLPEFTQHLGVNAFEGCDYLTKVVIPGSVEGIGEQAFKNCYNLKEVVIGRGVQYISSRAFEGCGRLKNLTIPYTIEELGNLIVSNSGVEEIIFEKCKIRDKKTMPFSKSNVKRMRFPDDFDYSSVERLLTPGIDMEILTYDENGNVKPMPEEDRKKLLKLPDEPAGKEIRNEEEIDR